MQHLIVEVGILHVLQSGLSPESTPLSANGGILGKDARVDYRSDITEIVNGYRYLSGDVIFNGFPTARRIYSDSFFFRNTRIIP